jgi:hypothetical protein
MGVFKEEAHTFETIAKKQVRIYSDAADYGYPFNQLKPTYHVMILFDTIKELQKLDKQFPEEKDLVRNRQTWGEGKNKGVSIDVIIFWEKDEGYYRGTKYSISFNETGSHPSKLDKSCDAYIAIDIEPYSEK